MKTMNELAERAYAFTQEMPQDTISAIHIFRETQEIGAYVKHSYEALRAIEEIAVRRGIGGPLFWHQRRQGLYVYIPNRRGQR